MTTMLHDRRALAAAVAAAIRRQPVADMHTHLYPPAFGECRADPEGLMLWGVDELVTYHYLVAELFRVVRPDELTPDAFYAMPKPARADLIWRKLFVERSPLSEACRGVLTALQSLGLNTAEKNLDGHRRWFASRDPNRHLDEVMRMANVETITMTNDVFDDNERRRWLENPSVGDDPRFNPVLRCDALLVDWPQAARGLASWGYTVSASLDEKTLGEIRRFLRDWVKRMKAIYIAVSLPPTFRYPSDDAGVTVLTKAVLPVCGELGLPFAMMIGVERGVNPALRQAGDMGFSADVRSVARLAADHPAHRFFVTMLARENQHGLAVAARKCGNLMPFGCWWFLNTPSLIEEITRMRVELLGTSFIPQHSDCRVLEQLIHKWEHSRAVIGKVLTDKYDDLIRTGRPVSVEDVQRDVARLLRDNFLTFSGRS